MSPQNQVTKSTGPNPDYIKNLFSSISNSYDRTNDLMTMGLHNQWKEKLVLWSQAQPGDYVLDCATGTGDIALRFKKHLGPKSSVIGSDFCQSMLDQAPIKANKLNLDVKFEQADVLDLPYQDSTFDVVSIAYGIRNVSDALLGIKEMTRVLKPGGRLMILETGDEPSFWMKPFIQIHFKIIVPFIGLMSSGNRTAYQYLNNSSLNFPCGKKFVQLMASTEIFQQIECETLMGGASFIYKGVKK